MVSFGGLKHVCHIQIYRNIYVQFRMVVKNMALPCFSL